MKESIGGVALFNIVILFILLFTGIMTITINRSKAYTVKDNIVTAIEDLNGIDIRTNQLPQEIVDEFLDASYRSVGTCPEEGYVGFDRNGELNSNPGQSSICIKETLNIKNESGSLDGNNNNSCYYTVMVFYKLDVPVIREVFEFHLTGETKQLYGYCSN